MLRTTLANLLLCVLTLALATPAARADSVVIDGQTHRNVEIVRFRQAGAMLTLRLTDGAWRVMPLHQVEQLDLTAQPVLAIAEMHRLAGRADAAEDYYRIALDIASDELARQIIEARLAHLTADPAATPGTTAPAPVRHDGDGPLMPLQPIDPPPPAAAPLTHRPLRHYSPLTPALHHLPEVAADPAPLAAAPQPEPPAATSLTELPSLPPQPQQDAPRHAPLPPEPPAALPSLPGEPTRHGDGDLQPFQPGERDPLPADNGDGHLLPFVADGQAPAPFGSDGDLLPFDAGLAATATAHEPPAADPPPTATGEVPSWWTPLTWTHQPAAEAAGHAAEPAGVAPDADPLDATPDPPFADAAAQQPRGPGRDILLLIDLSPAMESDLPAIREALRAVVASLAPSDRLQVILPAPPRRPLRQLPHGLLPATPQRKSQATTLIDRLQLPPERNDLPPAIATATRIIRQGLSRRGEIYLVTDGRFADPAAVREAFATARRGLQRDDRLVLHLLTVRSSGVEDLFLQRLADENNGQLRPLIDARPPLPR